MRTGVARADMWWVPMEAVPGGVAPVRVGRWYRSDGRRLLPQSGFDPGWAIDQVVRGFVGFVDGDPAITDRFSWQSYAI